MGPTFLILSHMSHMASQEYRRFKHFKNQNGSWFRIPELLSTLPHPHVEILL